MDTLGGGVSPAAAGECPLLVGLYVHVDDASSPEMLFKMLCPPIVAVEG